MLLLEKKNQVKIKTNILVNVKQSGKSVASAYTSVSCKPTVIYVSQWLTMRALQRVDTCLELKYKKVIQT